MDTGWFIAKNPGAKAEQHWNDDSATFVPPFGGTRYYSEQAARMDRPDLSDDAFVERLIPEAS